MRGAFYVTTALLITNSIRTAAEAGQLRRRQTSNDDGVALDIMDTEPSPKRFFQGSREQHGDVAVSAADEERMPEPSTRIIENALASSSEEALSAMRNAAHIAFDLNAPPGETVTGALEAFNIIRNKDPQTHTARNSEVPSNHLSNKRTTQALTSLDKASGFVIPKTLSGGQPKKLRTGAPSKARKIQSSISRDKMTPAPRPLSDDDVRQVHKLYLEHLERNSAVFKPTENETGKMLGLLNGADNLIPSKVKTYAQYVEELMKMDLKELNLDSKLILKPSLKELLEQPSEEFKKIQLYLLRLLHLKRWMRMYRDFFDFCLINHQVCSNLSATSTLQIELRMKKVPESSVELASNSAVLGTTGKILMQAERKMLKDVVDAVEGANLKEAIKKAMYKTVEEVYRDYDQLTSPDLSTLIAGSFHTVPSKRLSYMATGVLKTPSRPGGIDESLSGGQDEWPRDRKSVTKLLIEMRNQAKPTERHYDISIKNEDEAAKFKAIREDFIKHSNLRYKLTLEEVQKMWRIFDWGGRTSNPTTSTLPGLALSKYVRRLNKEELEAALGLKQVSILEKARQPEASDEESLLELQTEYLLILLKAYDKFYPFCVKNPSLCELPVAMQTKISQKHSKKKQFPRRLKNRQETRK